MCTVSFFKLSDDCFILTSNRDEKIIRETSPPVYENRHDQLLMFPKDLEKGGSWIAASESGQVACLLNGAFEPHVRNPPYAKSRGGVLLDSFSYPNIGDYFQEYDTENVEPFTLIIAGIYNSNVHLYEQRWDGTSKHLKQLNPELPHLWCSSSLYTRNSRLERGEYFRKWNNEHIPDPESILDLHHSTRNRSSGCDILMQDKYGLQTVSITRLTVNRNEINMLYIDRVKENESETSLKILPAK